MTEKSPDNLKAPRKEKNNSRRELLAELKEQFVRDSLLREILDNKTDKMLAMSSGFSTLLIGLGAFLVSRIEAGNVIFLFDIVLLSLGLICSGASIAVFIKASRLNTFSFPFGTKEYLSEKKNKEVGSVPEPNFDEIEARKDWIKIDSFLESAIEAYTRATFRYEKDLKTKAKLIQYGLKFFLATVMSISLMLIGTLGGIGSGYISFENVETKNLFPISNAGPDQIISENRTVVLDGTESHDLDGNIDSFDWEQIFGAPNVKLTYGKAGISTFTAPDVTNTTVLKFKLSVNDSRNASATDTVNIIVENNAVP